MPTPVYIYPASLVRVIDGDTVLLRVSLGFHLEQKSRFRLASINCPELATQPGLDAARYTADWLFTAAGYATDSGYPLIVESRKADDYGRWLVTIWRRLDDACLNDDLLASGNAVPWPAPKEVTA